MPSLKKEKPHNSKIQTLCTTAAVTLSEGGRESVIELLRVGTIRDRDLHITREMLDGHVKNFKDNTYGVDLQVNLGHFREGEAAGWFKDVYIEEVDGVATEFALVEWNEMGIEKITNKIYKYISAEFAFEYQDDASGEWRSHVLIGAALTNIPAMKRQKPVSLSEETNYKSLMFKQVIENMKNRAKLSAEDIALARQLLSEASAEDQEASKQDVEDLAKKQTEQAEAEAKATEEAKAAEAAKVAEEEKAKAEAQALSEKNGTVSLAEFQAVKQELARVKLSEEVKTVFTLSEKNPVGFREETLGEVTDFMVTLSDAQRATFKALMGKAVTVDLQTRGVDADKAGNVTALSGDEGDKVVAMTKKLMEADKTLSVADAQRRAMAEVKGNK